MSHPVKIVLYVVLAILAGVSGYFAYGEWTAVMNRPIPEISELERIEPENEPADAPGTNVTQGMVGTNGVGTNLVNPDVDGESGTNLTGALADPGATNQAEQPAAQAGREENLEDVDVSVPTALGSRTGASKQRRIGLWSGVFLLSVVGLAILIGLDVAHFFGTRTIKFLYNDDAVGMSNPEYEAAEQMWANGDHLEAIRMMREYLQKNPREQYVALRIAEIYEKDLGNYLAAALEYEEVLKHKLQPDRWGWAAIHLCNLYFKLNQEEKAYALLRRLVKEHPNVPAAEKARKRLEAVDGPTAPTEEIATESQVKPQRVQPPPDEPQSNLPPGFRPKK